MPNYKRRLAIILSVSVIWSLGAVWLMFSPNILHSLWQHPTAPIIFACWSGASIWGCYLAAKRMPHLALGLVLLAAFFVLTSIYVIAYFLLNIDDAWTGRMFYLIQALLPLATFSAAWQAVKKSNSDKRNREPEGRK